MASRNDGDWRSSMKTVLERNTYMFDNPLLSDISFTSGKSGRIFHAHKYVLATSSAVFEAMFDGDLAEKKFPIPITDSDEESWQEFLRFVYTDDCKVTGENAMRLMYLAKKYLILPLGKKVLEEVNIDPDNVFALLEQAIHFDEKELEAKCWEIVSMETADAVSSEQFCKISLRTLSDLLKRETLGIPECELFKGVLQWVDSECVRQGINIEEDITARRRLLADSVYEIRFFEMSQEEFAKQVLSCGILTDAETISIFQKFSGIDVAGLKWRERKKRRFVQIASFSRFLCDIVLEGRQWSYSGNPDVLSLVVNKAVLFHGVRLFGDTNGSQYEVKFSINDENVTGTYTSEKDTDGVWGFDVMLPKPIPLSPNEDVAIIATINGPPSHAGDYGNASAKVDDIVVKFKTPNSTILSRTNNTTDTEGQFYKIFLSKM